MKYYFIPRSVLLVAAFLVVVGLGTVLTIGCQKKQDRGEGPVPVKVAYLGLTCEAPLFVAQEKGFYKEESLDVELVKTDWDGLQAGLGTGKFDANHTLVMYLLKPIENGTNVKITGGVHTGCLRVQAGIKSDIKTVKDLRGKKIGIPTNIGSPPFLFANRVLSANGIDPRPEKKEVEWRPFAPAELEKALDNGQVDAIATSDPIGTILVGRKKVVTIADQAIDDPYKDEYCCATVVSGKLAKNDPQTAAKVTRAILKASKWVGENSRAAAEMSVEKKFVSSTVEINGQAISQLSYVPGIDRCKKSLDQIATEMQKCGLLKPTTDPAALAKQAWIDLDGVTDEWIAGLKVEKVANGGRLPKVDPTAFAALFEGRRLCCNCCCLGE
jgi:NitT/TauT family transport system substrate-binding protein